MSVVSLNTTMLRSALATLVVTSVVFSSVFYLLKIVPLPDQEMHKELVRVQAVLDEAFMIKSEALKDVAAAISGYDAIQAGLADEFERDRTVEKLLGIRTHFAKVTDYKNIQVHVFDTHKQSFVKSWNPDSFGQAIEHPLVNQVFEEQKIVGGITIGATSIALAGFAPVYVDDVFRGAISVIGGFRSLVQDLKKRQIEWVFLLDTDYLTQRYGRIPVVVEQNRPFNARYLVAHDAWFSADVQAHFMQKQIALQEGQTAQTLHFEQEGRVYMDFPAYDELGQVMGRHLVEIPDEQLLAKLNEATVGLGITQGVSILSVILAMAMMAWIVKTRVVRPISEMAEQIVAIEQSGDLSMRVVERSNDEVGQSSRAFNYLLSQMQALVNETNQVVDQMAQGRFEGRIKSEMKGDFARLKQGIHRSVETISQTMQNLSQALNRMQEGQFSHQLNQEFPGEYGVILGQAQSTMDGLNEIISDILQVMSGMQAGQFDGQVHAKAQGELGQLKTRVNEALSQLNLAMSAINRVVVAQSQGDLSQTIQQDFKGELDVLKQAVNRSAGQLAQTMQQILLVSSEVSQSSGEVAEGSLDLSQRTQQMAASIEQTAASMEELTATVKQNAHSAQVANKLAFEARSKASEGEKIAQEAIEAMHSVNDSAAKIAEIITLIDSIAFQTNLLALNAAVEAARAGEHGRGFAVVAGEVRALAQKSAHASQEIKVLIENSVSVSQQGSALVGRTGQALESISQSIQRVADLVSEISDASHEQGRGIEQMHQAISSLDSVTQQNAAMVEETSAAADSMRQQAINLKQEVEFFKV
jgi:methyl-accepting chemotaxis protein